MIGNEEIDKIQSLMPTHTNKEIAQIYGVPVGQIETFIHRKIKFRREKEIKEIKYVVNDNECWICTSHSKKRGYPRIKRDGITLLICKVFYEEKYGKIKEGLVIRHKCDNRECINPDHVVPGTVKQNNRDMLERDRVPNRILTVEDVVQIRKMISDGERNCVIARIYSINQSVISRIRHNKKWIDIGV